MSADSDVMIVEGVGGTMTPMDPKHTFLDVMQWLGAPVVVVARASLGTINHTLLTLSVLRSRKMKVAGVVINCYPADQTPTAEETNPGAIEKWGKTSILSIVPQDRVNKIGQALAPPLPDGVTGAIGLVDWAAIAGVEEAARGED